ncbi:hypothetical protein EMN47_09590 [Prolixibacteraceae bacterium JC049]|nr:hypothetical protein [Prolixibacteraceae bacterium JC049]
MEMLIPIFAIVATFGTLFGFIYLFFTSRNRERMALIEHGMDAKIFQQSEKNRHLSILKWSLFLIGIALGIFFGFYLEEYGGMDDGAGYFSMIFLFSGLGLLLAFYLLKKEYRKDCN